MPFQQLLLLSKSIPKYEHKDKSEREKEKGIEVKNGMQQMSLFDLADLQKK